MRAILAIMLLCTAFSLRRGAGRALGGDHRARQGACRGGDCASCHTADPAKPFAGGKRIDTPFGAIYSPNLTPDRDTGLGAWSDEDFCRALRYGVAPDGSRYYPAFPYPNFTKLTRDDVLAIRAYLATLTPLTQHAAAAGTALAAELPRGDAGLEFSVLPARHFRAGPAEKRGMESRRLSGHGCRALRRMPYAEKHASAPTSAVSAIGGGSVDGWFAPRLDDAARSGLKSWSVEDIVEYLQSGRNGRSHADGPMAEVVVNSTSEMSDADVRAIAVYLKDLPAGAPEPAVAPPPPAEMMAGKAIYDHACIACHEADGSGAPRIYPPLPGNANLQSADPASTLRIILDGAQTVTTPRAPNTGSMPAYAKQLSDQEIADVTNYIRNSWGNAAPLVSAAQVGKARNSEGAMPSFALTAPQSRLAAIVVEHEFRHFPFVPDGEQPK